MVIGKADIILTEFVVLEKQDEKWHVGSLCWLMLAAFGKMWVKLKKNQQIQDRSEGK